MPLIINPPPLTVQSTTNESQQPVVGLPVGASRICHLDAGTTTFTVSAPDDAKWVNISSAGDFVAGFLGGTIPPMPAAGSDINIDGLTLEVNPGLRYIGQGSNRRVYVEGITAGLCSVTFYS